MGRDLSTIDVLVCVAVAVMITALMWTRAVGWIHRHRERVREYLLDVERGERGRQFSAPGRRNQVPARRSQ
ncbi:hypothetical protein [Gordonia oryzae]|uniref:hypothetical protein n=1 Tax=Gordonia oryzae TaxID=2487349 RepID=UPI001FE81070|nr:hypothetical protein [Gordonia oryzae]